MYVFEDEDTNTGPECPGPVFVSSSVLVIMHLQPPTLPHKPLPSHLPQIILGGGQRTNASLGAGPANQRKPKM